MPKLVSIAIAAALQMSYWTVVAAAGALVDRNSPGAECLGMRARWVFSDPVIIPDGDRTSVAIGPLAALGESPAIEDVILGIEVSHPAPGDLSMAPHYDADNNGKYGASSDVEIYLARPTCAGALGLSDRAERYLFLPRRGLGGRWRRCLVHEIRWSAERRQFLPNGRGHGLGRIRHRVQLDGLGEGAEFVEGGADRSLRETIASSFLP